ncbi:Uncharacterised protein [Enterococcus hirae]|nr:Uncharacterised protein [Enterococcus hirae]VTS69360.1 Uncharacterised protein [Enterococcus hirae]
MYFTIAGNTKKDKELIKKATKEVGKRTSFLPKTMKYSVIETEEQLQVLGKVLEQESQSSVKLTLTLHDTEGKIEKAGTEYVFGPLDYQISEGFYPMAEYQLLIIKSTGIFRRIPSIPVLSVLLDQGRDRSKYWRRLKTFLVQKDKVQWLLMIQKLNCMWLAKMSWKPEVMMCMLLISLTRYSQ